MLGNGRVPVAVRIVGEDEDEIKAGHEGGGEVDLGSDGLVLVKAAQLGIGGGEQ